MHFHYFWYQVPKKNENACGFLLGFRFFGALSFVWRASWLAEPAGWLAGLLAGWPPKVGPGLQKPKKQKKPHTFSLFLESSTKKTKKTTCIFIIFGIRYQKTMKMHMVFLFLRPILSFWCILDEQGLSPTSLAVLLCSLKKQNTNCNHEK